MGKQILTFPTDRSGAYLDRLLGIETQLVGLHGLMSQVKNQDRYAGVLSLLEPVIHEVQVLSGDIHKNSQQNGGAK